MTPCPRGSLPFLLLVAWGVLGVSCSRDDAVDAGRDDRPGQGVTRDVKGGVEFADGFKRIRFEAERDGRIESDDAHPDVGGKLMRVVDDADASGGKCIEVPDKVGKPDPDGKLARAVYKFTILKPDNYVFWCRRWWLDQCGDTFAVRFDKEGRPHSDAYLFGADDMSKPPRWGWSPVFDKGKPRQFFFTPGEHVMEILNAEDGPRLDLILLTNDRGYVPSDSEELSSTR